MIQKCADPGLKPAIVERFIAVAGSDDPLSVTVRAGDRVVLVPQPKTIDAAMELIRQYVGTAVVRVGITQFPVGIGVTDAAELTQDLVDPCENIRMGTALFGKVYRIVTKWYGNEVDEAFDDAVYTWKTGYFEGSGVYRAGSRQRDGRNTRSRQTGERCGARQGDESRNAVKSKGRVA